MSEEQNGSVQPNQPEAPPPWFQQFTQQLGAVVQQQNAQIAQLARSQQAPPPPPKPAPAPPTNEVRDRILGTIVNEPERFVTEVVGFAEQRAEQKMAQREAQLRQELEYQRYNERFWGEFYAANPDLQLLQAEVGSAFMQTPEHMDMSARANYARDAVRQKLQMMQEQSKQAEQEQAAARRGMAGAPGVGIGAPMRDPDDVNMDETQRTAEALAERAAWKNSRRGDFLRNDPEYHEQRNKLMKQRRANAA